MNPAHILQKGNRYRSEFFPGGSDGKLSACTSPTVKTNKQKPDLKSAEHCLWDEPLLISREAAFTSLILAHCGHSDKCQVPSSLEALLGTQLECRPSWKMQQEKNQQQQMENQKGSLSLLSEKSPVLSPHGGDGGMNPVLRNICVTGPRGCRLHPVTMGTVLGHLGKGRGGVPFLKANEIFTS